MNTLYSALLGAQIWKKYIDPLEPSLVLILPDEVLGFSAELEQALKSFLAEHAAQGLRVSMVCANRVLRERLGLQLPELHWIALSQKEMLRLTSYAMLSAKQLGSLRSKNVRLVSFSAESAGQMKIIADSGLFPLPELIKNLLLGRE